MSVLRQKELLNIIESHKRLVKAERQKEQLAVVKVEKAANYRNTQYRTARKARADVPQLPLRESSE